MYSNFILSASQMFVNVGMLTSLKKQEVIFVSKCILYVENLLIHVIYPGNVYGAKVESQVITPVLLA